MTGADRFQLYLDKDGRTQSGNANVIRTAICLEGKLNNAVISEKILKNPAVQFLSRININKNCFSPKLYWTHNKTESTDQILTFHYRQNLQNDLSEFLNRECSFGSASPIHFDVVFEGEEKTYIIISVNHALLDYAGMEILLKSISENTYHPILENKPTVKHSFIKQFVHSVQATFFVAARSGWKIQKLRANTSIACAAFNEIILHNSENQKLNSKNLPYYLACAVQALDQNRNILQNEMLQVFIPVPLDRRKAADKNVLLSNRMSFLFFQADFDQAKNIPQLAKLFLQQMIKQAKLNIPEKFESLLELFTYLPELIYKAFLNLPSKGHSSTFAFSFLPLSLLEKGIFMGHKVIDYSHFPPFLSPPGLNLVIIEKSQGIKIICSYDKGRISENEMTRLMHDFKTNLLNS